MKICKSKQSLRLYLNHFVEKATSQTKLGFVPTMGYLHEGHLKLVKKSLKENQITLVSIFVNPTQFGPKEDLATYPRSISQDLKQLKLLGVDCVFLPSVDGFYRNQSMFQTYVSNIEFGHSYCGKTRPVFFRGVLTVVMKFFLLVRPDVAYFGEKDFQQLFLIKQMVKDYDLGIKIRSVSTEREPNGLALSSRNAYLKDINRAAFFYDTLKQGREQVLKGKLKTPKSLVKWMTQRLTNKSSYKDRGVFKVDYLVIVDGNTLKEISSKANLLFSNKGQKKGQKNKLEKFPVKFVKSAVILGAVYHQGVRLIDNLKI